MNDQLVRKPVVPAALSAVSVSEPHAAKPVPAAKHAPSSNRRYLPCIMFGPFR